MQGMIRPKVVAWQRVGGSTTESKHGLVAFAHDCSQHSETA